MSVYRIWAIPVHFFADFGSRTTFEKPKCTNQQIRRKSLDAYNESSCLVATVERNKSRTGHYQKRVLANQMYRTRDIR